MPAPKPRRRRAFRPKIAEYALGAAGVQRTPDASGLVGLDNDNAAFASHLITHTLGHRRGKPADTSLYEEMRRPLVAHRAKLGDRFLRHQSVTGYDVGDNRIVFILGRVGDQQTFAAGGGERRLIDRVVVSALDPDDFGAAISDSLGARRRDAVVQIDARRGASQSALGARAIGRE